MTVLPTPHTSMIRLSSLFDRDCVTCELAGVTPADVTAELLDQLVAAGKVPADDRDSVFDTLCERERQGSTGFGKGVAVPHAKHAAVAQMAAAFGRSTAGVDFKSVDGKPVHLVVLLLSPVDRSREHLDTMQTLFKALHQDLVRRDLREADTPAATLDVFRRIDALA